MLISEDFKIAKDFSLNNFYYSSYTSQMKNILKNERTQTIIASMNVSNETTKPHIITQAHQIKQRTNLPSLHKQNRFKRPPEIPCTKHWLLFLWNLLSENGVTSNLGP